MSTLRPSSLAAALALVLGACSPGVGRAPLYPDASEPEDGGFADAYVYPDAARPYDAGATDGMIALPDAAPRFTSDFSGMFGILNSTSVLYAREVGGKLSLVVDDFPYVYTGSITEAGNVSVESPILTRLGCQVARITGTYDRDSATYVLRHETCSVSGTPLASDITGGFIDNFVPAYSGVFELEATVNAPMGCYAGASPVAVRYAMSFLPTGAMAVWTADDLIATDEWYRGRAGSDGDFSALDPERRVQITGRFSQATALDPLSFEGLRDVYDPVAGCTFTITLRGTRTITP